MPGFVKTQKDEEKWDKAKKIAKKSNIKPQDGKTGKQSFYAFSNYLFHKMKKK